MAETPENQPNIPNMQKPSVPPNNKQKDKGLAELNKKMDELKNETKETKKGADKNTDKVVKALEKNTEETKPKKKTAEELSEAKKENKKFLDSLKGMFEGIKKGLTGGADGKGFDFLKPLIAMWGLFKRLGFMFAAGGLLSMVKIEDIEKVFHGIGKMFSKMIKFFKPILTEIGIYLKDTGIPSTMNFLLETFELVGETFDKLGKNFKGWTESGWDGKVMMSLNSLEIIGGFLIGWGVNVTNLVWNLFGYKGKVTEDVRKHFENVFGPDITNNIITLFSWVAGLMTVTQLFGPKFLKPTTSMWEGGWWRSAYFLFRTNITRLLAWSAGLVLGWPIAAAATVALVTTQYGEEIFKAVREPFLRFLKFWQNLDVDINNWAIKKFPNLAKALGWKVKGKTTVEEDERLEGESRKKELELAKAELDNLKEWKRLSASQSTTADAHYLGEKLGFGKRLFDSSRDWKGSRSQEAADLIMAERRLADAEHKMKKFQETTFLGLSKTEIKDIVTGKINVPGPRTMSDSAFSLTVPKTGIISPSMSDFPIAPLIKPISQQLDIIRAMERAKISEDFMPLSYTDRNTRSIGYGFNLGKPGAAELLRKAGIKATVQELKDRTAEITESQASRLQQLEAKYYTEQSQNFAGDLWGGMSAMQKEALWDMSYQMGSLMQNTGLKAAMVAGNNDKILWEIMKNSLYGKQTPGRARENAEMLMYKNQSGANLYARNKSAGADGHITIVNHGGNDQRSTGDNVLLSSSGGVYPSKLDGLS